MRVATRLCEKGVCPRLSAEELFLQEEKILFLLGETDGKVAILRYDESIFSFSETLNLGSLTDCEVLKRKGLSFVDVVVFGYEQDLSPSQTAVVACHP